MMKKLWSAVLVLCMILAVMTVSAFAAEDAPQLVDGYYEIYTADQLYWFAAQVNSGNTGINGKLMADIVVNENVLKADGTLNGDGSNFRVWTPIGNCDYQYIGTFDGNGKTVSGLYFKDAEKDYVGLFGCVDSGCVKNVGVEDSYLSGGYYVGGVVGYNNKGTVSDCYNTGSVSGSGSVGGVVGYNNKGTVSDCYNTGSVSGKSCVGGVVGYNSSNSTVSNCYNTGSVSGNDNVGGVVGYNDNRTVSNCYNTGSVNGRYAVGGVVGANGYQSTVSDCYNTGNVSGLGGSDYIGGVVGYNSGTIGNSYNTGSVIGDNWNVGGVVGYNYGTVSNCYNTGGVNGLELGDYIGGVVGYNGCQSTVSDCYNTGSVIGDNWNVGGVVGYNDGTVSNCYYIEGCASKNNGYGTSKTAQQFASGEVAYLLGQDFGQAIGTDTAPILNGKMVYQNQIGGCCADSFVYDYSNTQADAVTTHSWVEATCTAPKTCSSCGETIGEALGHSWVDATCDTVKTCSVCGTTEGNALGHSYVDGFCTRCGRYEPAVLNGDVYEISNAGQLYWFAAQVNGGKTSINGKLMADIVVNENVLNADGTLNGDGSNFRTWTPIGYYYTYSDCKSYRGTFDGNNKTVSGLYFNDTSKSYVGLFGYVDADGEVKNVGVVNSYLHGYNRVGGVVGYNYYGTVSNCFNTGSVSGSGNKVGGVVGWNNNGAVGDCYNTGSVNGSSKYVGGVVGYNDYDSTVSNNYNTGSVRGTIGVGGVVGYNSGVVSGCYNIGSVSGSGNEVGGVVGSNYGTVSDCYYLEGCVSSNNSYGTAKTAQQFSSGEVAYLLQGDQTEQVWGQLIGAEPYPVLSKDKVYGGNGHYYNDCDHYWDGGSCTEGVNCFICGAVSSYFPGHQWQDATCDQPKICSVCGTTEGEAQGHSYEGVVTEPDCTHAGFTTYTCTGCGDSYYEDFVAPLGHETYSYSFANGVHSLTCSLCGVTENMTSTDGKQLKFNTASPALAVDIVMNIAVTLPAGFTNPYMVVEFNGTTTTLNDYTIDRSNGRCVFAFPGINPQVMGDTFVATLYADVDGVQVTVELEYSMLKYINSQLKKSTISDALRTALSDLVMYGEANQVYEGYKTDALLSSLLEDAAKENLTPSTFVNLDAGYNQMAITGTAHSSIDLKGVSMALGSKIMVRMTVYCADPSAYTVKVTINGEDHLYPVSQLPLAAGYTDRYVLEFDQIRATQFGEVITFSFLDADGNQLGRTLTYSVYTYVQKNQGSANANLSNLLKAIYNYGESVKNI